MKNLKIKNQSTLLTIQKNRLVNMHSIGLKTLLIFFIALSFLNCSKDDDAIILDLEPTTQQLLIGKWNYETTPNGQASECEAKSFLHFVDFQTIISQNVIDDSGVDIVGAELIGDCQFYEENNTTYTLSDSNEINYSVPTFGLGNFIDITLKIVSITETTLVISSESTTGTTTRILKRTF